MSDPYIGEIRMFGGSYAPQGWYFCDGTILPISENDALFALIGFTYGGDGETTFALPDLRSRIPVHMGTGPTGIPYQLGQHGGAETTTLTVDNLPVHTHPLMVTSAAGTTHAPGASTILANPGSPVLYSNTANTPVTMAAQSVTPVGGSQPFSKAMPYQVINFIIAWAGIFPTQN